MLTNFMLIKKHVVDPLVACVGILHLVDLLLPLSVLLLRSRAVYITH